MTTPSIQLQHPLMIVTPNNDRYTVTLKGEIIRMDQPDFKPSGQWLFLGLEHVKRREFIPASAITPELLRELDLAYKNGNPQYTVRDFDHGSVRVWGNTQYHGVKSLYCLQA